MTWRSLLTGDERRRVRETALGIARGIVAQLAKPTIDASLYDGRAGIAVAFAYLGRVFPEAGFTEIAVAQIEQAIEATGGELMPGLANGMVGVAWAAEHLAAQLPDELDASIIDDDFDLGLAELVDGWPEGAYDLMTGLAGIGLYAATRVARGERAGARACLDRVVRRLGTIIDAEFYQSSAQLPPLQREEFPDGIQDLGLAHGVPGVIACLARIVRSVPAHASARDGLARAVQWMLAHQCEPDGESMFPRWITPAGARSAPFGWCYGDPGVACALRIAGEVLDDRRCTTAAREAILHVTSRIPTTMNPGICHGAGGIGHIFNRFGQAFGDAPMADAARTWILHAADLPAWDPLPQLLAGSTGHVLTLAAASSDEHPGWDDCMAIW